jgi:hypothetical protein
MKTADGLLPDPYPTVLDLNDLLLDHSAASYVFQIGTKIAIVDRAGQPKEGCMVIVEATGGFLVEPYRQQVIFGVVTHLIQKLL